MRVLGVDWGEARIGLAVSDETGTIASPYKVIANDGDAAKAVVNAQRGWLFFCGFASGRTRRPRRTSPAPISFE